MDVRNLGSWGERKAAAYLRRRGYKIVDMNCKYRQGEIDIVAENRSFIVFAEVKLRKNSEHGEAKEFVTVSKQRRVITAAEIWLQSHETEKQPRFDVIELYAPDGESSRRITINHIENAFEV
ncbi:MAG: YraN family protein [Oscillospiraceae bacterium]|nr:YraN family protein [Oscillospiraceae bacterium]